MLIERDSELAALDALLAAAVAGRGGAALVEGEAGIGKTALLTHARAGAAAAGARVLHVAADEIEMDLPLAAARVLLGRAARAVTPDGPARLALLALDGTLAPPSGTGDRADEVVHALWWLIVELTDEQPLALVVDDAQWADPLTLALLRLAARRAPDVPLALIVASRPAAPGQRHAELAAERAFERLEPGRLSVAGTARLAERLLGGPQPPAVAERACELAGGNPLYLSELLRAGSLEEPPAQLVRLIAGRLERLTPAAAALARAIAVLGPDAELRRARELAALASADALAAEQELRAERVLDARECRFAHPLVAAATRAAIGAAAAAELHARAAALLAAEGVDDQRVTEHLLAAPPRGDSAAVATLRRAAEAARRLGAPAAAARLLERALAEPPPKPHVDTVAFEHGRALLDAGSDQGERALDRVLRRAGDESVAADAARHLARRLALDGRADDAFAALTAALARVDGDRELRLELLSEAALVAGSVRGGRERALQTIAEEAAQVRGRTAAERLLLASARVVARELPAGVDPAKGARELLALRLHRDFPGGYAAGELTFSATILLINADALRDAERAVEELRADAEAIGAPNHVGGALCLQAEIAYQRGDLTRCELEGRAAAEYARSLATPWRVLASVEREELAGAEQLLADAGMLGRLGPSGLLHAAVGSRGRLRLAQGDAAAAAEDLADACDRSAAWLRSRVEPPWRPLLAEALVLAGRASDAAAEAHAYAEHAAYWGTRRALGHLARMRALVAARSPAIALLEEARAHFAACDARLELARCMVELGAHRRAAGERTAARAILRDAHDVAHACGATGLCRRARAELLLAGGRPRPSAATGVGALTPAERRVAEIAAQGASNREIARRLFLSPKTVEMHLRSAYRKLDLAGRGELAGALR